MRKRTGEVVKGFGTEFIKVAQFVAPRRARRPDTPREEDAPVAKPARRSACAPPRKVPARLERTPSPPLSYLEVMTSALTAARHAERTERSTRYDAFFAR